MKIATVTTKGQITIPVDVREALRLDAGDRIKFEEISPGNYSFSPIQKHPINVLKDMFGPASKSITIDEMNAAIARRGAAAK